MSPRQFGGIPVVTTTPCPGRTCDFDRHHENSARSPIASPLVCEIGHVGLDSPAAFRDTAQKSGRIQRLPATTGSEESSRKEWAAAARWLRQPVHPARADKAPAAGAGGARDIANARITAVAPVADQHGVAAGTAVTAGRAGTYGGVAAGAAGPAGADHPGGAAVPGAPPSPPFPPAPPIALPYPPTPPAPPVPNSWPARPPAPPLPP